MGVMTSSKSRRERRRRVPWESAKQNSGVFEIMRNLLAQIAMSRFHWHNLPAGVDSWYLEKTLFFGGCATLMQIPGLEGPEHKWYGTMVAQIGRWNVYDTPARWASIGNNGWYYKCDKRNAVLIWDNPNRMPITPTIDFWARELEDILRTKQINRVQARTPFLITAPQGREFDATQILKSIAGGEFAVLGYSSIDDVNVQAIQTGVPWLGGELMTDFQNTFRQALQALGVSTARTKNERMVAEEVEQDANVTDFVALASLDMRRKACDEFNDRFQPSEPLSVTWNKDNESDVYDALANPIQSLMGGGAQ